MALTQSRYYIHLGTFGVAMNEGHYRDLLFEVIPPTAVTTTKAASNLVQMGFPSRSNESAATLCACHNRLTLGGYICPRCNSKLCDIPTECDICTLTLVSSPLLARSYHHLFPVENFVEVAWKEYGLCPEEVNLITPIMLQITLTMISFLRTFL